MQILSEIKAYVIQCLDVPLGLLLQIPRDLTLVVLTLLTVGLLTAIRRLATNQNRLHRCAADLRQLKRLRREAALRRDPAAVARLARTKSQIRWLQLKADLIVLAVACVPLGLLATWAIERLDFLPARKGQELELTAYFPLSRVDSLAHLVPRPEADFKLLTPPVQSIVIDTGEVRQGRAQWKLRTLRDSSDFKLVVRHGGESAAHRLLVGGGFYEPPVVSYPKNRRLLATHLSLERYKFLGLDPHLDRWGLAPWLVAYLVLSIILMPLVRRLTRVS